MGNDIPSSPLFVFLQSPLKPLQQIHQTSLQDSESAPPSRATDVPSTLKDSGYGDIANESSRNLSPEDEPPRIPGFGHGGHGGHGGGLLQTITDGLEEESENEMYEGRKVKMADKPELISTDLPPGYINNG